METTTVTDVGPGDVTYPRDDLVTVEIDGELVVYDEDRDAFHVLDPIGGVIWARLDGERSLAQVGAELASEFGAPTDQVVGDIVTLVGSLVERDLVRLGGADASG